VLLYYIVLYCTVLCCPVLHCSTLPPGINPFAVNTNNNSNNFLCPILSKSNTRHKTLTAPSITASFSLCNFHHSDSWPTVLCRYFPVPDFIHIGQEMCYALQYGTKPIFQELRLTTGQLHTLLWNSDQADSCHEQVAGRCVLHIRHFVLHRKVHSKATCHFAVIFI
jgi:hypothetical protein